MSREFSEEDRLLLQEIMRLRRDVRGNKFIDKPISDNTVRQILQVAEISPSVGFSQPWEFVVIRSPETKQAVADVFAQENTRAKPLFDLDKQEQYGQLKLEGIVKTPVNVAVFYKPSDKAVLGQTSMDEMGKYSVVCAIQNMWLMARAMNIGIGWVSILDPQKVKNILAVPAEFKLVAYLCVGYVSEFLDSPELEQIKWEARYPIDEVIHEEYYSNKTPL